MSFLPLSLSSTLVSSSGHGHGDTARVDGKGLRQWAWLATDTVAVWGPPWAVLRRELLSGGCGGAPGPRPLPRCDLARRSGRCQWAAVRGVPPPMPR
jgi:hypothetical protein